MEFFATTETDRVPLFPKDADLKGKYWLEVKRSLAAGEHQELIGAAIKRAAFKAGEDVGVELDFGNASFLKIGLYVVDWNLPDLNGKVPDIDTLPKRLDALRALSMPTFREIERAVDEHVENQNRPKKSGRRGKPSSGTD